jgi:hypothetical protein
MSGRPTDSSVTAWSTKAAASDASADGARVTQRTNPMPAPIASPAPAAASRPTSTPLSLSSA